MKQGHISDDMWSFFVQKGEEAMVGFVIISITIIGVVLTPFFAAAIAFKKAGNCME